ncbi:hypothetical protein CLOM_g4349 [Closterium sp. NIES-68]|nr:hypothetical protein CLOM_g4349 [Closterium sp. NIES-68]
MDGDGGENEAIPRWDGGWERRHGSSAGWPAADGSNKSVPSVDVEPANERVEILVLRGPEGGKTASQEDARRKKGAVPGQGGGHVGERVVGRVVRHVGSTSIDVQSSRVSSVGRPAEEAGSPLDCPVDAGSASTDSLGLLRKCIRQVSSLLPKQGRNEDGDSVPSRELAVSSRTRYRDSLSEDRTGKGLEEAEVGRTPGKLGLFRRLSIGLGGWREGASGEEVREGMGAAETLWGRETSTNSREGNGMGMGIGGLNAPFGRSTASFARRRAAGGAAGLGGAGLGGGGNGSAPGGRISVVQLREMVEANPEAFLRAFDSVAKRMEAARKRRTVTVTSKYNSRTDILRSAVSLDIPSVSPFPFPLPSLARLPFFSSPSSNSSSSSSSPSSSPRPPRPPRRPPPPPPPHPPPSRCASEQWQRVAPPPPSLVSPSPLNSALSA